MSSRSMDDASASRVISRKSFSAAASARSPARYPRRPVEMASVNSGSDIPADDQSPDASPSPPPFLRAPRFAPNGIIPRALASAFPSAVPSTDASPPPAPNPAMSSSMRRPAASSFDATALDRSDRSTAVAADACGNLVRSTLAESAATRYAHSGNSRVSLVGPLTAATARRDVSVGTEE